jgi:hypothetical protein
MHKAMNAWVDGTANHFPSFYRIGLIIG